MAVERAAQRVDRRVGLGCADPFRIQRDLSRTSDCRRVRGDVVVADTLARVLSILSLSIVAFGAVVAVMTYRRDRARLALRWSVRFSRHEQQLEVTAVNDGRQPLVVEEVAIQDSPLRWPRPPRNYPGLLRRPIRTLRRLIRAPSTEPPGGSAVLADGEPERVMLRPGEARTFRFSLSRLEELVYSDELYLSAVDPLGREVTIRLPVEAVADAVGASAAMAAAFEPQDDDG